jgi:TusA-related sulfurtransferase
VRDFEAFARQTGNDLVSSTAEGEQFVFRMRRR